MTAVAGEIKAQSLECDLTGKERSYSYVVKVEAALTDGPLTVCTAQGLPLPLRHVFAWQSECDDAAVCRRLRPKQIGPTSWEVTCEFSTHSGDGDSSKNDPARNTDDPLSEPIDWEFRPVETNLVLPADLDGKPMCNFAWEPFEPEVATVEWAMGELLVRRNERDPSWSLWHQYNNKVNDGPFYGASPGCVRFCPPTVTGKYRAGVSYIQVQYRFLFDERGLEYRHVINQGEHHLVVENGVTVPRPIVSIAAEVNRATLYKALLDWEGHIIADQDTPQKRLAILNAPNSQAWCWLRIRERMDFSALRLGG